MKHFLFLLCILTFSIYRVSNAHATASIAGSVTYANVPRAGLDLPSEVYYGSAMASNMFLDPGFELPSFGRVIQVRSPNSTTFETSDNISDPATFWNGTAGTDNCVVAVGTCSDGSNNYCYSHTSSPATGGCTAGGSDCDADTTFTISAYSGGTPETFTCAGGSCPLLTGPIGTSPNENEDVVGCQMTFAQGGPASVTGTADFYGMNSHSSMEGWDNPWAPSTEADVYVTNAKAFDGNSSLLINSTGGSQNITTQWDGESVSGFTSVCSGALTKMCSTTADCTGVGTCLTQVLPFHNLTGSMQLSLYAWTATAGATITVSLSRSSGGTDFSNHVITLTADSAWHQYTYSFTGADTAGSQTGTVTFTMAGSSGSTIYVDDMFLGKTNGADGFTNDILTDLKALNVGTLRESPYPYVISGGAVPMSQVLGTDYQIAPAGEIETSGVDGTRYPYTDLVAITHAVDADAIPWFTYGIALPQAQYAALGAQLCTWESTYAFTQMIAECNNEDWNGGSLGKVTYPFFGAYGEACSRAFAEIKMAYDTSCASTDSDVKYLLNNQTGNSGVITQTQNFATFPNTAQYGADDNTYITPTTINSGDSVATTIAGFFANGVSSFSNINGDVTALCAGGGSCNQVMGAYEGSPQGSGYGGTGTALQASIGSAGFGAAGSWMQELVGFLSSMPPGNLLPLHETYSLQEPGSNNVAEWGITPGNWGTASAFAPTFPWFRPSGLAMELFNSAIANGAGYYACTNAPSGIYCDAFKSGSSWTLVASNSNSTSTSFSVTFPSGTVPPVAATINYTSGLSDNNENSNSVTLGNLSGGVSYSGQTATLTMPAFGAVALLQGGAAPYVEQVYVQTAGGKMDTRAKIKKVTISAILRRKNGCRVLTTHEVGSLGCKCTLEDLGIISSYKEKVETQPENFLVFWFKTIIGWFKI